MDKKILDFFTGLGRNLSGGKLNLGNILGKAGSKLQGKSQTFTFQDSAPCQRPPLPIRLQPLP